MPLYQLLGGAAGAGCLAYGHASGARAAGAVRLDPRPPGAGLPGHPRSRPASPGLKSIYGVASSATRRPAPRGVRRYDHEPARRSAVPGRGGAGTPAPTCATSRRVFEAVRNEFGPELPLLHDAHHRLTPIQAAKLGKSLEPYDLFWLEDVHPAENQAALRRVREHTTTPLAIGEVFNTIWDYRELFEEQLIDYVRCPVTHAGGITGLRRIFDYAGHVPDQVRRARAHRRLAGRDGGRDAPRARASPTSASRSTCGTARNTDEVFRPSYTFDDGLLNAGDEPGLGVSLRRGAWRSRSRIRRHTCR